MSTATAATGAWEVVDRVIGRAAPPPHYRLTSARLIDFRKVPVLECLSETRLNNPGGWGERGPHEAPAGVRGRRPRLKKER